MDKDVLNRLFLIVTRGWIVAGIIFLIVFIFDGSESNWEVVAALICVGFSGLFGLIKKQFIQDEELFFRTNVG